VAAKWSHSALGIPHTAIRQKWFCALLFLAQIPALLAAPGRVTGTDGSSFAGDVRIDPALGIVITDAGIGSTNISLSRLESLEMDSARPSSRSTLSSNLDLLSQTGWTNQDVGEAALPGSARLENGTIAIASSGTRIWLAQPDEFHFVYRTFKGNGQIVAEVQNVEAAVAGIMFRRTLEPDSEFVLEAATPGGEGLIFRTRRDPRHRELVHLEGDWRNYADLKPPCRLKILRQSKRFVAYASLDEGVTWQHLYESPDNWDRDVVAGLFVVGGVSNQVKRASFANILIEDETDLLKGSAAKSSAVQVTLNDGSILNADSIVADRTKVKIAFGGRDYSGSIYAVARLIYGLAPDRLKRELTSGRKGVLLKTGDFFEGDLQSADTEQVKISSVLFGPRSFPRDRVLAILMAGSLETSVPFLLRTQNGSVIRAKTLVPRPDAIVAEEPRLGPMLIPLAQLAEVRRGQ
jgi:hypothetical protein